MSADLHIHALEGATERDVALMKHNSIGSKFCPLTALTEGSTPIQLATAMSKMDTLSRQSEGSMEKVAATPNIWVGSVSWLKAAIFEDGDKEYVPGPVQTISEVIGEDFPVIDDDLITRIMNAFCVPNVTRYELADPKDVRAFLDEHKGKKAFTVSW